MLPEIDEKQITWQNIIETVVSDRLDEDAEPTIEGGHCPSPVEVTSPLLDALRQFPQQHYRRDCEVEWPDSLAMQDTVMIDLAIDEGITAITEWARGRIILAFGIPVEEDVNIARDAFMLRPNSMYSSFCTPSRYPITGGDSEGS